MISISPGAAFSLQSRIASVIQGRLSSFCFPLKQKPTGEEEIKILLGATDVSAEFPALPFLFSLAGIAPCAPEQGLLLIGVKTAA